MPVGLEVGGVKVEPRRVVRARIPLEIQCLGIVYLCDI